MNNNKNTVIGLVAVVVIAVGALVYFMTRSGAGADVNSVKEQQTEAQKQVPAGIGKPTDEQAHEGLHQMGGGGKTSTAPPVGGGIAPK